MCWSWFYNHNMLFFLIMHAEKGVVWVVSCKGTFIFSNLFLFKILISTYLTILNLIQILYFHIGPIHLFEFLVLVECVKVDERSKVTLHD